MRIGCVFENGTANAHYRALMPLRALERRGHRVVWPRVASITLDSYETPRCDVMLLHRCFYPPHVTLVQRLRERGIAVVWDNDDDFSSMGKLSRLGTRRSKREHKEDFARSVEIACMADRMTTPSATIAALYGARGARTAVIENAVPAIDTGRPRQRVRGLTIGCCAAREHLEDFKKLKLARAIEAALRGREGVRVVSIGMSLELRGPGFTSHGQVELGQMMEIERGFDIGLAPLVDTAFNRARSNVKLKEYAAAGAMWLASPVGPYRELGPEQGGLLVADRNWTETLSRVIEDEPLRRELTERARAWAASQTLERTARRWETVLQEAISDARAAA